MPKSRLGTNAMTTTIMTRFRSLASRMWDPLSVTLSGTRRKASKASNVECKKDNGPPFAEGRRHLTHELVRKLDKVAKLHCISFIIRAIPCCTISCISIFDEQINSHKAKSSGSSFIKYPIVPSSLHRRPKMVLSNCDTRISMGNTFL